VIEVGVNPKSLRDRALQISTLVQQHIAKLPYLRPGKLKEKAIDSSIYSIYVDQLADNGSNQLHAADIVVFELNDGPCKNRSRRFVFKRQIFKNVWWLT
jgi:hypothetical protein